MGDGHGDWPGEVDRVLDGDLAVMLADVTPANGVVLTPLTNFALRDRAAGTVTVLSSLGAWRKLRRLRREPRVALVFHTRRHGYATGSEYVLVQGRASFRATPDRTWLEAIEPNWTRFMGPRDTGLPWGWWLDAYQWQRIGVHVAVHRVVSWPDLECRGTPRVHGAPLPEAPPGSQPAPARGTSARVDPARLAERVNRLPDTLLGWVGADGFPFVVPVSGAEPEAAAVRLAVPPGLVPPGERRAGLTAHWFSERVLGQEQRGHTGWLSADAGGAELRYAPHTATGYRLPPSRTLYRLVVGGMTRRGLRAARRAGFA